MKFDYLDMKDLDENGVAKALKGSFPMGAETNLPHIGVAIYFPATSKRLSEAEN